MDEPVSWNALARKLGTVHDRGESASTEDARRAVAMLIGEANLCNAVDYYCDKEEGSELVRHVLALLRPWSSMKRCYQIHQEDEDPARRRAAVELLRLVADKRVIPWILEFLEDDDQDIQLAGVGILDQLLWRGLVKVEEVEELLRKACTHRSEEVRKMAQSVQEYLQRRNAGSG